MSDPATRDPLMDIPMRSRGHITTHVRMGMLRTMFIQAMFIPTTAIAGTIILIATAAIVTATIGIAAPGIEEIETTKIADVRMNGSTGDGNHPSQQS